MLLALETSAERGSLALFDGERLIGDAWLDAGERHAASLLVCLDRLLAEQGRALAEVDRIALSIGPGSFTGLRIGLATALGLAFGTDRLLVPVPSLAALATQAKVDGLIAPILDARRGRSMPVSTARRARLGADSCGPSGFPRACRLTGIAFSAAVSPCTAEIAARIGVRVSRRSMWAAR
jgi:tRNA threonylcarbamoyl adenosine modification protein YeaZ